MACEDNDLTRLIRESLLDIGKTFRTFQQIDGIIVLKADHTNTHIVKIRDNTEVCSHVEPKTEKEVDMMIGVCKTSIKMVAKARNIYNERLEIDGIIVFQSDKQNQSVVIIHEVIVKDIEQSSIKVAGDDVHDEKARTRVKPKQHSINNSGQYKPLSNSISNECVTLVDRANTVNNHRVTSGNGANTVGKEFMTLVDGANNVTNHLVKSGNGANTVNYQGVASNTMKTEVTGTTDQISPEVLNALGMDNNANDSQKLFATSSKPESQTMTNVPNTLMPMNSLGRGYYIEKGLPMNEEPNIQCAKCDTVCENIDMLEIHNSIGHQLSTCFVCTRTVKTMHNLKRHVQQHLEPRLECLFCNKKFHDKANLKRHVMTHANKSPGVKRNKRTFSVKPKRVNANIHRAAKKKTERECCKNIFVSSLKWRRHLKSHNGVKSMSFRCFFCERTMLTFKEFSIHQRTHTQQQDCVRGGLQTSGTESPSSTTVPTTTPKKVQSTKRKDITNVTGNGGRETLPQVDNNSELDTASCGFCKISFMSSKYLEAHLKENPSHKL